MSKYFCLLLFFLLVISCNQSPSQIENDYIKNLEEKNRALEEELKELKESSKTTQETKQGSDNSNDYFIIGSTIDEVLEVMGEPTSYLVTAPEARQLLYGTSTVSLYKDKVISYDNFGGNLKVRVKE